MILNNLNNLLVLILKDLKYLGNAVFWFFYFRVLTVRNSTAGAGDSFKNLYTFRFRNFQHSKHESRTNYPQRSTEEGLWERERERLVTVTAATAIVADNTQKFEIHWESSSPQLQKCFPADASARFCYLW